MRRSLIALVASVSGLAIPIAARAHCPLCTAGAGAAALIAAQFGVGTMSIGIFIGAFGWALGAWIARVVRWPIPWRAPILGIASFLLTVLPLRALLYETGSLYLSIAGAYGSLLNRTYVYDRFVVGSIFGAMLLIVAPSVSGWIARRRGRLIPYQGVAITMALLIGSAVVVQFL